MAHELTIRADGRVEMAYTGDTPWHGLGQKLEPTATIDEWIVAAGMDWKILRAKIRYPTSRDMSDDPAQWRTVDDQHVFFRSDTGDYLGTGSAKFRLVQPKETLEFYRDLIDAAGFKMSAAGTLFGGTKFWSIAETDREAVIIDKRDIVRAHLLCASSCDGSMATIASYLAQRVVCDNTLRIGLNEKGATQVKVSHRSKFDPIAVKRELGIESAMSNFDRTIERMRHMAETRINYETTILATAGLFHADFTELDNDRKDKILRTKPVEPIARMACDNDTIGADFDGAAGTVYGWLNAVTQYVDHEAVTRGESRHDNRIDSAWFGNGAKVKEKAFAIAGAIADAPIHRANGAVRAVNDWLGQFNK